MPPPDKERRPGKGVVQDDAGGNVGASLLPGAVTSPDKLTSPAMPVRCAHLFPSLTSCRNAPLPGSRFCGEHRDGGR